MCQTGPSRERAARAGAGKTFTLANMDPKAVGMMPRAMADIFNHAATDVTHTYRIYMSYVQIYMEIIKDLLLVSSEQLQIREDTQVRFPGHQFGDDVVYITENVLFPGSFWTCRCPGGCGEHVRVYTHTHHLACETLP